MKIKAIMLSRLRRRAPEPPASPVVVTRIKVKQLGLSTGKFVKVHVRGKPRRIEVKYVP